MVPASRRRTGDAEVKAAVGVLQQFLSVSIYVAARLLESAWCLSAPQTNGIAFCQQYDSFS